MISAEAEKLFMTFIFTSIYYERFCGPPLQRQVVHVTERTRAGFIVFDLPHIEIKILLTLMLKYQIMAVTWWKVMPENVCCEE